jgi:ribosomal protein L37AE/L43A
MLKKLEIRCPECKSILVLTTKFFNIFKCQNCNCTFNYGAFEKAFKPNNVKIHRLWGYKGVDINESTKNINKQNNR